MKKVWKKRYRFLMVILLIISFLALLPIREAGSNPAYEDFTSYTEVDPGTRINKTATHIDFIARNNETSYLWKEKGIDYFSSIFEHFLDVRVIEASSTGDFACVWAISDIPKNVQYWRDYSQSYYAVMVYKATTELRMVLEEKNNGSAQHNDYGSISLNTWYYIRIVKKSTSLQCKIYTTSALRDIGGVPDLDTLSLTVTDNSFRRIFACNTINNGQPLQAEVDIEKFELRDRIIEYDSTNNIITCLGGTETNPINFNEVWLADQVGGWGVFTKTGNRAYACNNTEIDIGDGNIMTFFYDESCSVNMFGGGSGRALKVLNNATATFGTLLNADRKSTSKGVSFIVEGWYYWNISEGSTFNLYGCSVVSDYNLEIDMYGEGNIYNCIFSSGYYMLTWYEPATYDIFNVVLSDDPDTAVTLSSDSLTIEDFRVFDSPILIYLFGAYPCTIKNLYAKGATDYTFHVTREGYDPFANFYFIDAIIDSWTFDWASNTQENIAIFRQYTFNLAIFFQNGTSIENANVTMSNDFLETSDSWLTFANGSIPQQIYSMGHYNKTGGNSIYSYNPYNISVSYPGYETYRGMINITDKLSLEICLCPAKVSYGLGLGSGFILALIISLALIVSVVAIQRKRS